MKTEAVLMKPITLSERRRFGDLLKTETQEKVMAMIPQFSEVENGTYAKHSSFFSSDPGTDGFGAMVFNIERGVNLPETIDFLKYCPDIRPFDLILANELDDGCVRSGGRMVAREIAEALGMNYVYGLEFIELANPDDPKGFHGNAIFTCFPVLWSETFRLPEENNWYFDRQTRIGGRCAVFAKLAVGTRELGVVSMHLENRTDGAGRRRQLDAVIREAERVFPGIPVLMGGDLNTNTFDGRSVPAIEFLSEHPNLLLDQMAKVEDYEPCLIDAEKAGFNWRAASSVRAAGGVPYTDTKGTRRKKLPDGTDMLLRLDWLMPKGLTADSGKTISTLTKDCGFAPEDCALAHFEKKELSDHNAVWAHFRFA
jgi:endonuclease/exonuclease/phosphatase family metal-dependent hydrolase